MSGGRLSNFGGRLRTHGIEPGEPGYYPAGYPNGSAWRIDIGITDLGLSSGKERRLTWKSGDEPPGRGGYGFPLRYVSGGLSGASSV